MHSHETVIENHQLNKNIFDDWNKPIRYYGIFIDKIFKWTFLTII